MDLWWLPLPTLVAAAPRHLPDFSAITHPSSLWTLISSYGVARGSRSVTLLWTLLPMTLVSGSTRACPRPRCRAVVLPCVLLSLPFGFRPDQCLSGGSAACRHCRPWFTTSVRLAFCHLCPAHCDWPSLAPLAFCNVQATPCQTNWSVDIVFPAKTRVMTYALLRLHS